MAARYTVIIKVNEDRFIKYRNVNNLVKLVAFLDNNFPEWKYFNVYDKKTRQQVGNFTQNNKPTSAKI